MGKIQPASPRRRRAQPGPCTGIPGGEAPLAPQHDERLSPPLPSPAGAPRPRPPPAAGAPPRSAGPPSPSAPLRRAQAAPGAAPLRLWPRFPGGARGPALVRGHGRPPPPPWCPSSCASAPPRVAMAAMILISVMRRMERSLCKRLKAQRKRAFW